uniref:Uncharacterized protein n=1 Tax=Arundo donax TaxID=35708 RepID=A0A0A9HV46_ARUDO
MSRGTGCLLFHGSSGCNSEIDPTSFMNKFCEHYCFNMFVSSSPR